MRATASALDMTTSQVTPHKRLLTVTTFQLVEKVHWLHTEYNRDFQGVEYNLTFSMLLATSQVTKTHKTTFFSI